MKVTISPALFFILVVLFSSATQAESFNSYPKILLAQNNNQSLDQAVNSIKQQTGGRILSTKTTHKNGRRVYKIKVLLPSGKIQTFNVKAK